MEQQSSGAYGQASADDVEVAQGAFNPDLYLIAGTDPEVAARYATLAQRAQTARFGLMERDYVVIDTETTGLNVDEDELTEIAAALMNGPDVLETFQTFVNPGRPIPEFISQLTSITDDDVADAPYPDEAVQALADFVGDRLVVAHNAGFDLKFIQRHGDPMWPVCQEDHWVDSLGVSRIAMPRLVSHDQSTMCQAFGVRAGNHRAIGDVLALCKLWRIMLVALDDMPRDMVGFIANMAPDTLWPARTVIASIAAEGVEAKFSMRTLRDRQVAMDASEELPMLDPGDAVFDLAPLDTAEIEQAFTAEGVVGHMYPNFERRPEQVDFAQEVARAFHTSTHRVVEAGTGVGKSISYLLPAVLFAKRNRVRVGIATKTNTLLDQLMYSELPRLDAAMRQTMGQGFSYISLKGYDHYPCLRKLMRYASNMPADSREYDIVSVATVITAVSQATWSDLDALSFSLSHRARPNVVCSSEECLHNKCPYFPKRCLLHGARRKAIESQIVVTNHALLFRDMALDDVNLLPPIGYWVVDEAHGIEEEARGQLSYAADESDLQQSLHKLASGSGPLKLMQQQALVLEGGDALLGLATKVISDVTKAQKAADTFFSYVDDLGRIDSDASYAFADVWINDEVRSSGLWQAVLKVGEELLERIDSLVHDGRKTVSLADQFDELAAQAKELASTFDRLDTTLRALSLVLDGTDPDYYYCAHVRTDGGKGRGKQKGDDQLVAALIDLGAELSQRFFPQVNSVVLTSATIAVGSSFDYFAHRVGLDRIDQSLWRSSKLEPTQGFYANMHTLVVRDLPEPRSAGYDAALRDLLLNVHLGMGGGVLTLFTNRREMTQIYEELQPVLKKAGIKLLCQSKNKSKRMVRDEFVADEDACLFATRSFWEGFDAPGRTLRCVVLPKLPFSRPDDPLYQERSARQNDAWKAYVLPQAIIDTKQAAGRLIRSKQDSGFLVLCDRRLQTKWYGKVFLRAFEASNLQVIGIDQVEDVLRDSHL